MDQSCNNIVRLTLWGQSAESFDSNGHVVIAVKGARVSDFGGRSLSMFGGSKMTINPDIPEAHALRGWYDTIGCSTDFQPFSSGMSGGVGAAGGQDRRAERKLLSQIKDENMGQGEKVRVMPMTNVSCSAVM